MGGRSGFASLPALAAALRVLAAASLAWPVPSEAQVAPTEVNEKAIDGFGLERKTGRFSWEGTEVIAIGGETSRIGMVVTGIRNPAWAETTWPLRAYTLNVDGPTLASFPMPDETSPIPGAINPYATEKTVSYFGGSETFNCKTTCYSEYFTGSTLESNPNGYVFTDRQGLQIYFEEYQSRIVFPDGREITYRPGKFRKNNFGFMLKTGGGSIQAVNRAVDYCDETSQTACASLGAIRTASISTPGVGLEEITNPAGETTRLRWEFKTAKRYRRPQGADPSLYIPDITERYPVGIQLPGSAGEDITIAYHSIDPALDTHDDIWVSSITRHGVAAAYQYTRVFPYGISEATAPIHFEDTLDGMMSNLHVGTMYNLQNDCLHGDNFACDDLADFQALMSTVQMLAEQESLMTGLPAGLRELEEEGSQAKEIYELTIVASVAGQPAGESLMLKPAGLFGSNRRRLLHTIDVSGRKTEYQYNQFEEIAGTVLPEGNSVFNVYDGRGNVIQSTAVPKPDSNQTNRATLYAYEPDCTTIPLARCNKPLSVTDAHGNVTEYTYNDRGQMLTETRPAPAPGAVRPKVTNTYTMRTAYIEDASGNPVAAGPPVSLLTRTASCITQASCAGTADEVVTEYDYGPTTGFNNLLLRGIAVTAANELGQIETLRTCFGYNYFGERISETEFKAGMAVCP